MRDESKAFISDKCVEDKAVQTETKGELKHLSSQSWHQYQTWLLLIIYFTQANVIYRSGINNRLLCVCGGVSFHHRINLVQLK